MSGVGENFSDLLWSDAMVRIVRRARKRELALIRRETDRWIADTPWLREILERDTEAK